MPNPRLIYDFGMHKGEDTEYYLKKGFEVVSFEANPELAAHCRERFAEEIAAGRLTIVEGAVAPAAAAVVGAVPSYCPVLLPTGAEGATGAGVAASAAASVPVAGVILAAVAPLETGKHGIEATLRQILRHPYGGFKHGGSRSATGCPVAPVPARDRQRTPALRGDPTVRRGCDAAKLCRAQCPCP